MAWYRCGGCGSKITSTIETYTNTVSQGTYTFDEDIDELIVVASPNGTYSWFGYVESNLYDSIIVGKEYAWGNWDQKLIVTGVKAGFQIRFGYAQSASTPASVYIIKSNIE